MKMKLQFIAVQLKAKKVWPVQEFRTTTNLRISQELGLIERQRKWCILNAEFASTEVSRMALVNTDVDFWVQKSEGLKRFPKLDEDGYLW